MDLFEHARKTNLLIVDSYSGYIDFKMLTSETSADVIKTLKRWFAKHGAPRLLESDNRPYLSAKEFRELKKECGFEHQTSRPRYPQSNGLAERAEQVAKNIEMRERRNIHK